MSLAHWALLRRVERIGLRRLAALHLLAFLSAAAMAPHRHINSIEDLGSDGPSDSGIVLLGSAQQNLSAGPQWDAVRFADDDPCLACFHNDWATEPIAFLILAPSFSPTTLTRTPHDPASPALPSGPRRSRAPPASA